jgi:hypothetical protein
MSVFEKAKGFFGHLFNLGESEAHALAEKAVPILTETRDEIVSEVRKAVSELAAPIASEIHRLLYATSVAPDHGGPVQQDSSDPAATPEAPAADAPATGDNGK